MPPWLPCSFFLWGITDSWFKALTPDKSSRNGRRGALRGCLSYQNGSNNRSLPFCGLFNEAGIKANHLLSPRAQLQPGNLSQMDLVQAAEATAKKVREYKEERHAARGQVQEKYVDKMAEVGDCMRARLAQHEKEMMSAHRAQVERLLAEVDERTERQAIICKKLAEIRNECLNLSTQLRAVYTGREEQARALSFQSCLDIGSKKEGSAA